jgi:hypothetical protein
VDEVVVTQGIFFIDECIEGIIGSDLATLRDVKKEHNHQADSNW